MTPKLHDGALSVYQFDQWRVRILDRDGAPWWILADVCDALGLSNPAMVAERLADDEKMTISLAESHSGRRGGAQSIRIVNESGLYAVILRSDKPEAKRFRQWITGEVLPSIRKTGSYSLKHQPRLSGALLRELRLSVKAGILAAEDPRRLLGLAEPASSVSVADFESDIPPAALQRAIKTAAAVAGSVMRREIARIAADQKQGRLI